MAVKVQIFKTHFYVYSVMAVVTENMVFSNKMNPAVFNVHIILIITGFGLCLSKVGRYKPRV